MAGYFDHLVPNGATQAPDTALPAVRFPDPPSAIQQALAKVNIPGWGEAALNTARGVAMGAADPSVGLVQLAANAIGQGDPVNAAFAAKDAQYEAERTATRGDGFDAARFAGNVASPVNAILAAKLPLAATAGARALQGAGVGAVGGLSQPVVDAGSDFAGNKAAQALAGAATGGTLGPVLGKLGDAVARRLTISKPTSQIVAAAEADQIVAKALAEVGQAANDLPPNAIAALRHQVTTALAKGERLDPAAMLRLQDFQSVGIPALQGQVTRDPMQFAQELNLRGVANVGEPIAARLMEQNTKLQAAINAMRSGADDNYNAGTQLVKAMSDADRKMGSVVSGMYQTARNSAGKDLDVPLTGLAQDYARVLSDFGDNVPGAIRGKFAELGLDPATVGNQKKVFTIEDADKLLKVINSNDPGPANLPMMRALSELRSAVKGAVTSVDANGGPFAPAVKAAAERFALQDAIPALKDAGLGKISADDFVRRYIINGKTDHVRGMAEVLRVTDQEAYQQARAQMGAYLYQKAFGADVVGTKGFAAESFNKALRDLGAVKLGAFFAPDEVSRLRTLGRVGAYIHQEPAGAAVNRSNTASTWVNLMQKIPGGSAGSNALAALLNSARNSVKNNATVNAAVNPSAPITPIAPDADIANQLAIILSGGAAAAGGGVSGAAFR